MSGHGTSFFESKTWKNIMKYVYGLGAAVVIMGALFKIMHWPGASLMLIVGLSTEAVIFIMSVLEPVHLDADWSRVFPELSNAEGEGVEEIEGVGLYDLIKSGNDEPGSQADKLAEKLGLQLGRIPGSGEGGRVVKRDVENFKMAGATGMPVMTQEKFTEVGVSQMRKVIASRLAESKFSAPHFYLNLSIDMSNAIAARKAINDQGIFRVSFNDMVVKAAAMALRKHPAVNSSWLEDRIRYNEHVHIGVAVAVEDGLLVPVVRFADGKSFAGIGEEVRDFAAKAKSKKLQPEDWEGNTFTISNLGMFGIESFTAIINPPDACILAIGGINEVPVVKDGVVVPGSVMKVTLSCDHRVVDGATGAAFLQDFKNLLENPVLMLV